ncbi:MAG: dihydroorotase [Acidimicrobiaceae bacterium]|nr:dihydroorotase [Acidimicrobiaceae bacterium]
MAIDKRITGGRVVTPTGVHELDILVSSGRIAGLVTPETGSEIVAEVIDASGYTVLPGMVDVHVHTREPGYTHKEDITTTGLQAAAGGVTTIFGMPNLEPPTTTLETLEDVLELYRTKSIVDYNHNPAPTQLGEIQKMADAGVRAFKIYMVVDTGRTYPHPAGTGMHDHGHLLEMMDLIAPTGRRFIVHPHDQSLMDYIEGQYLARGENTPQGYAEAYASRDGVIWDTAIDVILRLAEAANCPIHIAHMQTRRSIDAVRSAKARGVDVTCEVNHWALFLSTWDDVERLGPYALSYWVPDDARAAVWEGLVDGTIDIYSSDHAPHTRDEKEIGWTKMWSAHTGTPGIQYLYPLLLGAVAEGRISLERAVDSATRRPAKEFGLEGVKGSIEPGCDADLVFAAFNDPWTITNDEVLSRCGWTPYDGRECSVRIVSTLQRGEFIYRDGKVVGEPGRALMAVPR